MKKLILIVFLLFTFSCFGAELLVKAKPHWKDSWSQAKVDKLTVTQKEQYETRSQIGDIVVVKPNGWEWGREECLPNFVVIQVPDMTYDEAKIYEESLMDNTDPGNSKMLKHRKYNVEKQVIDELKALDKSKVVKEKLVIKPKIIKKDK